MNPREQRWRELPVFRELFLQWRAARAGAAARSRPFPRDWERLLQDAQLTTAELRREADRDARELEAAGLVQLKTFRLRPYQIERIAIPLAAEARLKEIFADELPAAAEKEVIPADYPWVVQLDFLRDTRLGIPFEDLRALNEFLARAEANRESVPIKERSLEIFGDEKRLDALLLTSLFRPDRLTGELLRCHVVPEPLAWKRGRKPDGPVIVLENAATWETYCRWGEKRALFSGIVYGCGNRFRDGVIGLREIFGELGGVRRVLYFGDVDLQGARIPVQASAIANSLGLPPIEPDFWSYEQLLARGKPQPAVLIDLLIPGEFDWFGDLAPKIRALLESNCRIAQEAIGWDFLSGIDERAARIG